MAEHLLARGTVAENHREAFAGRGAVAELLVGSAMAKRMAAPWRIAIGKLLLARALQRSKGLVSFFDASLMQIIPIFVVW